MVLPEPIAPEIKIFSGSYSNGSCVFKPRPRSNANSHSDRILFKYLKQTIFEVEEKVSNTIKAKHMVLFKKLLRFLFNKKNNASEIICYINKFLI